MINMRAIGRKALNQASYRLSLVKLGTAMPQEVEAVRRLREDILSLEGMESSDKEGIDDDWTRNRLRLRQLILRDDPRRFLSWDVIRRTMFVADAVYLEKELAHLRRQPNWQVRWQQAIQENDVGRPQRLNVYPSSSGNNIHHAYHLLSFEEAVRVSLDTFDVVIEIGGGYGNMCRLIHRLGFRGVYLIFDLPEFAALQRYFLTLNNFPVMRGARVIEASTREGVFWATDVKELKQIDIQDRRCLFVACWSLSEISIPLRNRVLCAPIVAQSQAYLIGYQQEFAGLDNQAFFDTWQGTRRDVHWKAREIPHLRGNYYLIGWRGEARQPSRTSSQCAGGSSGAAQ